MLSKHLRKLSSVGLQTAYTNSFDSISLKGLESSKLKTQKTYLEHMKNLLNSKQNSKITYKDSPLFEDSSNIESLSHIKEHLLQNFNLVEGSSYTSSSELHELQENFIKNCEKFGVSSKIAKQNLSFLRSLNLAPPASVDLENFPSLLKNLKLASEQYKEIHIEYLRKEFHSLEKELEPLKIQFNLAKTQAQVSAERKFNLGLTAVLSHMFGIYSGAYLYLGIQSALVGGYAFGGFSAAAAGGIYYSKKLYSYGSVKEILFEQKLKKIISQEQVNIEKMSILQTKVDLIRGEIIELMR